MLSSECEARAQTFPLVLGDTLATANLCFCHFLQFSPFLAIAPVESLMGTLQNPFFSQSYTWEISILSSSCMNSLGKLCPSLRDSPTAFSVDVS